MPRDPLGPRNLAGLGANLVIGTVVLGGGLVLAVSNGGRVWLLPLIGATLLALCAAELYLDPVGGPRRGVHGVLRERRQHRLRSRAGRSRDGPQQPPHDPCSSSRSR